MKNEVMQELGKLNGKQMQETNAELREIGKRTKGRAEIIKILCTHQLKDAQKQDKLRVLQESTISRQAKHQESIAAIVSDMTTENESLRNSNMVAESENKEGRKTSKKGIIPLRLDPATTI